MLGGHSQAYFCAHRQTWRMSLPVTVPWSWQHGPGPEFNCFLPLRCISVSG